MRTVVAHSSQNPIRISQMGFFKGTLSRWNRNSHIFSYGFGDHSEALFSHYLDYLQFEIYCATMVSILISCHPYHIHISEKLYKYTVWKFQDFDFSIILKN